MKDKNPSYHQTVYKDKLSDVMVYKDQDDSKGESLVAYH